MKVAVATVTVDVPHGTPMAGFAARTGTSTGVHDPTSIRTIIFDTVSFVAVDACALHEDTCARIRERALRETGLVEVIVAATHTHSGPNVTLRGLGAHSSEVLQQVVEAAHRSIVTAWEARVECKVEFSSTTGVGIAKNRRDGRDVDPPITCLKATHDGTVLATLVSYPCHPVVLDAKNTLISGDYPHFLRTQVEKELGGTCVFMTGCAGDINTGHRAEDSYQESASSLRTMDEAERIGRLLAKAVASSSFEPIGDTVTSSSNEVAVPLENLSQAEVRARAIEWQEAVAQWQPGSEVMQIWIDWANRWSPTHPLSWQARTCHIQIGNASVLTLPGEPFLDCAVRLKKYYGARSMVLGYCDGVPGYFPVECEYDRGGYEVVDAHRYYDMPAPFAKGAAEALLQSLGVT
ncbi:neutral/alkaline non-lysosomal ceramidase N-terminal domain-containing protein [Flaviflexus massiliensis]|uniref:neutral/alkaline non-lysosomal ceramidase N-terminal domain-containing protein n=1 Tax=Flaviflexus massiliensis TaxID=1522309 RepID=UPI0006D58074|nr:neutral/alkaline non-lysosomal ceramidase N-terminal domain-containing protein [Flaviflexus massiliensis]